MYLPGFFINVELGDEILSNPTSVIDVSDLNFALVLSEDEEPVAARWTTWGLEADTLYLYQSLTDKNKVIGGNNGFLYVLNEDEFTDAGIAIPIIFTSSPLPEITERVSLSSVKRVHRFKWGVRTPPPSSGYNITLTLTDIDDPSNTTSREVLQRTQEMDVSISISARQFRATLSTSVTTDFDLVYWSYIFQTRDTYGTTQLV